MDNEDHFDIQDFITSTLELQEDTYKAQQDLEEEYVNDYFLNKENETQLDLLEEQEADYEPSIYLL
tara:strand:+ start:504 stop:701 length:198 start_codon:yes stop_codon:yes gene_type:complete